MVHVSYKALPAELLSHVTRGEPRPPRSLVRSRRESVNEPENTLVYFVGYSALPTELQSHVARAESRKSPLRSRRESINELEDTLVSLVGYTAQTNELRCHQRYIANSVHMATVSKRMRNEADQ